MGAHYYVNVRGTTLGPFSEGELVDKIRAGELPGDSDVCEVGEREWHRISDTARFGHCYAPPPPPSRPRPPPSAGHPGFSATGAEAPAQNTVAYVALGSGLGAVASIGCCCLTLAFWPALLGVFAGAVAAVVAVVCGFIGRRKAVHLRHGKGAATAGIALGFLWVVLVVVATIVATAVGGLALYEVFGVEAPSGSEGQSSSPTYESTTIVGAWRSPGGAVERYGADGTWTMEIHGRVASRGRYSVDGDTLHVGPLRYRVTFPSPNRMTLDGDVYVRVE